MGTDLTGPTTGSRIQSVTHSLGLIIASFATGILFSLVALSVLGGFLDLTIESAADVPVWLNVLQTVLIYAGFFAVSLWYLWTRSDADGLFEIGLPSLRDVGWVVLGFLGLIFTLNVLSVIITALDVDTAQNAAITQGNQDPVYFLYLIPIAFLLNGPAEELLFRGVVQGLFRRSFGVWIGVAAASLLFGFFHIGALIGGGTGAVGLATTLLLLSILGVVLGVVYERTQNLLVPMVIHGLFNAMTFGLSYLRATGQIQVA